MIQCAECLNPFKAISTSHLRTHGMTMAEYRQRHPKADLGWKKATVLSRDEAEELYVQQQYQTEFMWV